MESIKGYNLVKPWTTSAALALTKPDISSVPTVEDSDNDIYAWPVSNPFNLTGEMPCSESNKVVAKGHPISGNTDYITSFPTLNDAVVPKPIFHFIHYT